MIVDTSALCNVHVLNKIATPTMEKKTYFREKNNGKN